uniref:Transmembrane protein 150B n=1 Tax=Marmota marmota marmota TaxID=9994 RepID=A0A8C5YNG4_MARMA
RGYLSLLPAFLALWAIAGVWIVFGISVANRSVDLSEGFPFISVCGSDPPQSCLFSQLLNAGAAMAAWICIVRYHQLRDWGVATCHNQSILWLGLLCALGASIVGNFQEKHQKPIHLVGAFLAFIMGNLYFWLQLLLSWRMKGQPQPGAPWIWLLRLTLCSLCSILTVAMIILYFWPPRSASAICEWAVAMLLFTLFGLFAVDFSSLDSCSLSLQPRQDLSPPPDSPVPLQVQLQAL